MMILETLEQAQGGKMLERVAAATGFSPSDARKALEALCPSIAARVREGAATPAAFEALLSILDDNGGDLLDTGDVAGSEVGNDGQTVLKEAYGSTSSAQSEAAKVAQALRLDPSAIQKLLPIAAALVLAVLGKRYREVAGPAEEENASSRTPSPQAGTRDTSDAPSARGGLLTTVIATAGAAAARAIINRMLPRRRRYSYSYGYTRRRRRRRREPTLNDLFRGLLR